MKSLFVLGICSSFLLSGCSIGPTKPLDYNTDTAVDVTNKFYRVSGGGLIDPYRLIDPVSEKDGIRSFKKWWCLAKDKKPAQVISALNKKCTTIGGTVVGNWCEGKNGTPEFQFIVGQADVVSPGAYCTGGYQEIGAIVNEKISSSGDSSWIRFATRNGFATQEELNRTRAIKQEQEERDYRYRQEQKAKENKYMLSRIGTRICRDSGKKFIFIGFIEDATNEKIKISVNDAVYPNSGGLRAGGFQPSTIWDYPSNWYVCE